MDSKYLTIHFFFILLRDELNFASNHYRGKKIISFKIPLLLFE